MESCGKSIKCQRLISFWIIVSIPCSGRARIQGSISDISSLHLAICRSYDLIRGRVRTIKFFPHSFASFRSRDHVCVFYVHE